MKRFNSIKKNSDFQAVYRNGRAFSNRYIVMYVYRNGRDDTRIGISASRKFGNSVERHRFARLIRECFRLNKDKLSAGHDIVVIARAAAKGLGYAAIENSFINLCRAHKIIEEPK